MRFEISKTVQLQPYSTLQDVIKLALKVEALNKYGGFTTNRIKEGVHKPQQESTSKSRQCFKYHEFGHIASECPNRRVVDLVENMKLRKKKTSKRQLNLTMKIRMSLLCPIMGLP